MHKFSICLRRAGAAGWTCPVAALFVLAACGSDRTEFGSHDPAAEDGVIQDDAETSPSAGGPADGTQHKPPVSRLDEEDGGGLPLGPSDDECAELEEESCTSDRGCAPIFSQDEVYRGCHGQGENCKEVLQCGRNSEGVEAEFSGCMPFGWGPCGETEPEPTPMSGQACETVEDCTHCGHQVAPPEQAGEQCTCPPQCPSIAMHKQQCAALTEAWADRLCSDQEQVGCPLAGCEEPDPLACVNGQCVLVQALPRD